MFLGGEEEVDARHRTRIERNGRDRDQISHFPNRKTECQRRKSLGTKSVKTEVEPAPEAPDPQSTAPGRLSWRGQCDYGLREDLGLGLVSGTERGLDDNSGIT